MARTRAELTQELLDNMVCGQLQGEPCIRLCTSVTVTGLRGCVNADHGMRMVKDGQKGRAESGGGYQPWERQ